MDAAGLEILRRARSGAAAIGFAGALPRRDPRGHRTTSVGRCRNPRHSARPTARCAHVRRLDDHFAHTTVLGTDRAIAALSSSGAVGADYPIPLRRLPGSPDRAGCARPVPCSSFRAGGILIRNDQGNASNEPRRVLETPVDSLRAISLRMWRRIDRWRFRPGRAPRAGIPRRSADRLRPYLGTRLATQRRMTMTDSLRAEVPSFVFFILVPQPRSSS